VSEIQQQRVPSDLCRPLFLVAMLLISFLVQPSAIAEEFQTQPPSARLANDGPFSASYPSLQELKYEVTMGGEKAAVLMVDIEMVDDQGEVLWNGPTQYWGFQREETHLFRTPFSPEESWAAGEYLLRATATEHATGLTYFSNRTVGEVWIETHEVSAEFTPLEQATLQIMQGKTVNLFGEVANIGAYAASLTIEAYVGDEMLAETGVHVRSGQRGLYQLSVPTESLPTGTQPYRLLLHSTHGDTVLDELNGQFDITEPSGSLDFVLQNTSLSSITLQQNTFVRSEDLTLFAEIKNPGTLFCTGALKASLLSPSSTVLDAWEWAVELDGAVREFDPREFRIPLSNAGTGTHSVDFEWLETNCPQPYTAPDPYYFEVKQPPAQAITKVLDDGWDFEVSLNNTGVLTTAFGVKATFFNDFGRNELPMQTWTLPANESHTFGFSGTSTLPCFTGTWDMQLDVFAEGELLESSLHPFFAQSQADGFGDADIVKVSIDKTSALPGETVIVDVDVEELLELCTTQFVLTASMRSSSGELEATAHHEEWFELNPSGTHRVRAPLVLGTAAKPGPQVIEVTVWGGENEKLANQKRIDTYSIDTFVVDTPIYDGTLECEVEEIGQVVSNAWTRCSVKNAGNSDAVFRILSKHQNTMEEFTSVSFLVNHRPGKNVQNFTSVIPKLNYGDNTVSFTLQVLGPSGWEKVHDWVHDERVEMPTYDYPARTISNITSIPEHPVEGSRFALNFDVAGDEEHPSGIVRVTVQRQGGLTFSQSQSINWGRFVVPVSFEFYWPSDDCQAYDITIELLDPQTNQVFDTYFPRSRTGCDHITNGGGSFSGAFPDLVPTALSYADGNIQGQIANNGNVRSPSTSFALYADGSLISTLELPALEPNGDVHWFSIPSTLDSDTVLRLVVDEENSVLELTEGPANELSMLASDGFVLQLDLDNDGLDDDIEQEGWEVNFIPHRSQYEQALSSLENGNFDMSPYVTTYWVTSSTSQIDSDHDGWSDYQEYLEATDPRRKDTDGDGMMDSVDPDPLIVELQVPEVTLWSLEESSLGDSTSGRAIGEWLTLVFSVEDENLETAPLLVKNVNGLFGDVRSVISIQTLDEERGLYSATYQAPLIAGYEVVVVAEDRFGNSIEMPIVNESGLIETLTTKLTNSVVGSLILLWSAPALGVAYGTYAFLKDIGEGVMFFVDFLTMIYEDGFIQAFQTTVQPIVEYIRQEGFAGLLLEGFTYPVTLSQEMNPYSNSLDSATFRFFFVATFFGLSAVASVLTAKALNTIPLINKLTTAAGDLQAKLAGTGLVLMGKALDTFLDLPLNNPAFLPMTHLIIDTPGLDNKFKGYAFRSPYDILAIKSNTKSFSKFAKNYEKLLKKQTPAEIKGNKLETKKNLDWFMEYDKNGVNGLDIYDFLLERGEEANMITFEGFMGEVLAYTACKPKCKVFDGSDSIKFDGKGKIWGDSYTPIDGDIVQLTSTKSKNRDYPAVDGNLRRIIDYAVKDFGRVDIDELNAHLRKIEGNNDATIGKFVVEIYFEGDLSVTKGGEVQKAKTNAAKKGISVEFKPLPPNSLAPPKANMMNAESLVFQNATIVEYTPTDFSFKSNAVMVATFLGAMTLLGLAVAIRRR